MRKLLVATVALSLWVGFAQAQQSVFTIPTGQPTASNPSSTVAVTNTFQLVFAANVNRKTCLIQNNGTHNMYVFFGAAANAALTNSIILVAGYAVPCAQDGVTNNDSIYITGTASDAYYASQQ